MSSIDKLKTLLNFKISDGSKKLRVFINENSKTKVNCIILFYDNDTDILALAKHSEGGYFSNGIQIVCKHNDYEKARNIAYNVLKYISSNRKPYQGVYFIPDSPPKYSGIDESTGGYTFSLNIKIKGGE